MNKNFIMGANVMFGYFGDMCSLNSDSYTQMLASNNFESVVMPEYNIFDFQRAVQGKDMFYSDSTPNMTIDFEKMNMRIPCEKYFVNDFIKSRHLFNFLDDEVIFRITRHGVLMPDVHQSTAYSSLQQTNRKLQGIKPQSLQVIEDLVLKTDLKELRAIFFDLLQHRQELWKNSKEEFGTEAYPQINDYLLLNEVRELGKLRYPEILYKKHISFSASLIRSVAKTVRSGKIFGCLGTTPLIEHIERVAEKKNLILPSIMYEFRSYLNKDDEIKKSIEKNISLSKYYTNKYEETTSWEFVEEAVRRKTLPNDHDLGCELYKQIDLMPMDEVLEKFAILSYILDNDWLGYINHGVNIWEHTIFDEYFRKKYGANYFEPVTSLFLQQEGKYRTQFNGLSNKFIENILSYQKDIHLDKNPDALHNQEDKKFDDSLGIMSQQYAKKMKYLNETVRENKNSEILADPMTAYKENSLLKQIYSNRQEQNINQKMSMGINQIHVIQSLQRFAEGKYSYEDLQTIRDQIIEVNSQLQLIKLPKTFMKDLKVMIFYHKKNEQLKYEQAKNDPLRQVAKHEIAMINEDIPGKTPVYEVSMHLLESYMQNSIDNGLSEDKMQEIEEQMHSNPYIWPDHKRQSYKLTSNKEEVEHTRITLRQSEGKEPDHDEVFQNIQRFSPEQLRAQGIRTWKSEEQKMDQEGNFLNKNNKFMQGEQNDLKDLMKEMKKSNYGYEPKDGEGPQFDDYKASKQAFDDIEKEKSEKK